MNLNNPNLRSVDPPGEPDYLAGAVLQGLARPIGRRQAASFFEIALGAIISFGVLPIVELTRRFRDFVTMEQQQLWHLAEWLRLHSDHPDAPRLREDADALAARPDMQILARLATAFVGVIFFTQMREISLSHTYGGRWFSALLDSTWLFQAHYNTHGLARSLAVKLFAVWSMGLAAAYTCYWRQVSVHIAAVRKFIERFNRIAAAEELQPVAFPETGSLAPAASVVSGAALVAAGAYWGIPLMFAATQHRLYITRTSVALRAALAHRLRAMLLRRHPSMNVPTPIFLRRACKNELCRAAAPEHATYCPRCGKRLAPPLHLLA